MSDWAPPADVLPHRPPFLFLDEVTSIDRDGEVPVIHAKRTFAPTEEFFRGHFPGRPIVPGVLLIEAMAQAFAYLAMQDGRDKGVYLTGVDRARFRKPVLPGECVELVVRLEGARLGMVRARAEAWVGEDRVADARLSGMREP